MINFTNWIKNRVITKMYIWLPISQIAIFTIYVMYLVENGYILNSLDFSLSIEFMTPLFYLLGSYFFFLHMKKRVTYQAIYFAIDDMPRMQMKIDESPTEDMINNDRACVLSIANKLGTLDGTMIGLNYSLYVIIPLMTILYFIINNTEILLYMESILFTTLSVVIMVLVKLNS